MTVAPLPPDEPERLAELRRYGILDTPPEEGFDRITRLAARLLAVPVAQIVLVDAEREWVKSAHGGEPAETPRRLSFCAWSILASETLVIEDCRRDARVADDPTVTCEPGIRFYAGALLRSSGGRNLGTLCVMDEVPRRLSDADRRLLEDAAGLVMDQLELRLAGHSLVEELAHRKRSSVEIERLAFHDPLTGVANRRRFQERLDHAVAAAAGSGGRVGLLIVDLDRFKGVNDSLGHDAGDAILTAIAERLQAVVRDRDTVARLGGDEFAVVLPEVADVATAQRWGAALADALQRPCMHGETTLPCSASLGIALFPDHAATVGELLVRADRALYRAKAAGRGVACIADPDDHGTERARPSAPPPAPRLRLVEA